MKDDPIPGAGADSKRHSTAHVDHLDLGSAERAGHCVVWDWVLGYGRSGSAPWDTEGRDGILRELSAN